MDTPEEEPASGDVHAAEPGDEANRERPPPSEAAGSEQPLEAGYTGPEDPTGLTTPAEQAADDGDAAEPGSEAPPTAEVVESWAGTAAGLPPSAAPGSPAAGISSEEPAGADGPEQPKDPGFHVEQAPSAPDGGDPSRKAPFEVQLETMARPRPQAPSDRASAPAPGGETEAGSGAGPVADELAGAGDGRQAPAPQVVSVPGFEGPSAGAPDLAGEPPSSDPLSAGQTGQPPTQAAGAGGAAFHVEPAAETGPSVASQASEAAISLGDEPMGVRNGMSGRPPTPAAEAAPRRAVRPLPRVMAVANQKGGVGKTTTAVNLGAALAELGYRTLVVDLDPQGNATTGLGINARTLGASVYDVLMREVPVEDAVEPTSVRNLFVVPATIDLAGAEIELVPAFSRELRLKRALEGVADEFDFTLIDCPPSLGLLTVNALAAATEVVVPVQCEYYALEGLSALLRNVQLVQTNLNKALEMSTIILTMYDARTKLAEQVASEVRLHFGDIVCRQQVPRTVRLSEAPSFGQPILVFDPTSRGAIAYRELAKEVSGGTPQRVG